MFIGRMDAEAEAPMLWPPDATSQHTGRNSDAGEDWGQEEKGDRGWDGRMASQTWWRSVWANSLRSWRTGKPGMLRSKGSQRTPWLNNNKDAHVKETAAIRASARRRRGVGGGRCSSLLIQSRFFSETVLWAVNGDRVSWFLPPCLGEIRVWNELHGVGCFPPLGQWKHVYSSVHVQLFATPWPVACQALWKSVVCLCFFPPGPCGQHVES